VVSGIKEVEGVIDVHHLHVWAISTSQNAMTAHIITKSDATIGQLNLIKKSIKLELEHFNINHATIEFEAENENCIDSNL
jgi:cobalt-zinc-cadmium efflux system protein